MLIDVPEDRLGDKVEFSIDNAVMLVRNSSAFETWMNSTVFHLDTFRDSKQEPTALRRLTPSAERCVKGGRLQNNKRAVSNDV